MALAIDPPLSRRRVAAFLIVVAVHLLLGLLLYLAAPRFLTPPIERPPIVVTLLPSPEPRPAPTQRFRAAPAAAKKAPRPPVASRKPPASFKLPIIVVSKADLAAGDISKIPSVSVESAAAPAGEGQPGDTEFADGAAPGGERLYKAEWYRRPRHAELAGYLPNGAPEGSWGIIACKTIDKYYVEDCQELDESPRGSGIARSLRQAAWQFRVRPPRLGGKDLFGVWVSIRIVFDKDGDG